MFNEDAEIAILLIHYFKSTLGIAQIYDAENLSQATRRAVRKKARKPIYHPIPSENYKSRRRV